MPSVDIEAARTLLCDLVDRAASGEDVAINRDGEPLARITRCQTARRRIRFGVLTGRVRLAPDFDAALSCDVLSGFESR